MARVDLAPPILLIAALLVPTAASSQPRAGYYLAFGDSITAGYDDSLQEETPGYPGYLEPLLQSETPGAQVIQAGRSGESSGQGLLRLPSELNQSRPQFALIMEGINDLRNGASAAGVAFNLEQMMRQCQAREAIPIFATILPDDGEVSRGTIGDVNARIAALVGDGKTAGLADSYPAFAEHPEYFGGIHPTQTGYQVLAQIWLEGIRARGTTPPPPYEGNLGDIDGSGRVDGWDLLRLAFAFGTQIGDERYDPGADVNLDATVDGSDLAVVASHFGQRL